MIKEKIKQIKNILSKKVYLKDSVYYAVMFAIPIIGILLKNILLQAYINGDNLYSPDFKAAVGNTWRYWIFYIATASLVLSLGMMFKKERARRIYFLVCNFFFTALVCCDVIYIRSFFTMPSAADALILKNFSGFDGGEVSSLLCKWDILLFWDIIILALFFFIFRKKKADTETEVKKLRKTAVFIGVISIAVLIFIPLQAKAFDFEKYECIYEENNAEQTTAYLSSLGFHIKDIIELIQENLRDNLTGDEEKLIDSYFQWKNENLPDNEYAGIYQGKNVLFLQIESLESFVIGQYIENQEITPNINKLVNNGFYFKNIFEQVQGGNSSDADLMYTTSRLPVLKGSTFFRYEDVKLNSLPGMLGELGYTRLYAQAVRGSFWNYENCWEKMIGVDTFIGSEKINMNHEKIGFTINDGDFIDEIYPYVQSLESPYYAHIVLNSSHMPFQPQDAYKNLDLPEDLDSTYLGGYLQLVNYVDAQIGEMLADMEADGLLDNTVIVVIGDHNGIHKYYEYSLEEWYEEYPWVNVNGYYTVPLIVGQYGEKTMADAEAYSSDIIGGQIDVMPTLSYLLGIPEEKYVNTAMGRNLLKTERSFAIYRTGEIYGDLSEKEKEIVSRSYDISELLFEVGR